MQCELAAEVARTFGELRLNVTGSSMLPAIWPGDELLVQRRDICEIQPGQVILYRRDGGVVAHRVKARDGERLITRGDALGQDDLPVGIEEIVGVVVAATRRGRAVKLELTPARRVAAWTFCRSGLLTRVLLHVHLRYGRSTGMTPQMNQAAQTGWAE
jgi:signal peptidase I